MIKNRTKEIAIGILSVIAIFLLAFLLEGESIEIERGITGYVVSEQTQNNDVQLEGFEFKAIIQGETYWYMYTTDNKWYESKDDINWKRKDKMPDDLWKGIAYLKSYDAKLYYDDEEVKDITDLARKLR